MLLVAQVPGDTGEPRGNGVEKQKGTPTIGDPTPWLSARRSGDIAYFLYASPPRIEGFHMNSESWLVPIQLEEEPRDFAITDTYIFVAYRRSVVRFSRQTGESMHITNTVRDISGFIAYGDYLYLSLTEMLLSVHQETGVAIDSRPNSSNLQGFSIATTLDRAFASTPPGAFARLFMVRLNSDGTIGMVTAESPRRTLPYSNRTFVFPDESRVADDSGFIYNSADFTYANQLPGPSSNWIFSATCRSC